MAALSKLLKEARQPGVAMAALLAAFVVLDLRTPRGFSTWVLYLLAVIAATKVLRRRRLLLVAGLASACTVLGFAFSPPGNVLWISAFSRAFGILLLWAIVAMELSWRRKDKKLRSLEKAVSGSNDIVLMTDPMGIITFINPAFTQTYGYTEEEVVGKVTPRLLKSGTVSAESYKVFWEILLEKRPVRGEFINKTKDGRLLTVDVSASAILDGRSNITGFLGIQRDITEHKRAEEEVRKSQARLEEAQRSAQLGSWEWDIVHDRAFWSQEMHRIFGVHPQGPWPTLEASLSLIHPQDRPSVEEALNAAFNDAKPYDIDYRITRPDGAVRFVHAQGEVQFDQARKPLRMVGTVQDITERKRAEEELQRLNRALRTISECNQALVRATSETELLRNICQILVDHGGFRLAWVGYVEQDEAKRVRPVALAGQEDGYLEEIQVTWADEARGRGPVGTAIRTGRPGIIHDIQSDPTFAPWREDALRRGYVSAIALPLIAGGRTLGALALYSPDARAFDSEEVGLLSELANDLAYGVAALRNREERLRAEKALKKTQGQFLQAQKMEALGRLAGGVAHDFNNLLTVINGYCDMLLENSPAGSPHRSHLEEIGNAGQRAAALTRQLLTFSRKQITEPRILDLNSVVESAHKLLLRIIGEDIVLVSNLAKDLGHTKADPGQVEQVIMNLVVNARDAMPSGGTLTIETANTELDADYVKSYPFVAPGPYVMLALSDTGCGMSAELQSHIFEPFYTTKESGKGTGLGLSTAYGIVSQSGGHIHVYSEVGKGTTFRVYLPRVDRPVDNTPATTELGRSTEGVETILLVEDEPGVRTLAQKVLQSHGYTVLAAGAPDEALATSDQHNGRIDLLLTDVIMPGMSGKDLADQLALSRPELAVLFISGYTADAIGHHGILEKGVSFLPKPFTPRELLRKIRQALNGSTA